MFGKAKKGDDTEQKMAAEDQRDDQAAAVDEAQGKGEAEKPAEAAQAKDQEGEKSQAPDDATSEVQSDGDGEAGKDAAAPAPAAAAGPDWKDMYARTLADFENFRKRSERDRAELATFAAAGIIKDVLATADNLSLALEKAKDPEDPFVKGVKMAYDGFIKILSEHGATPLDAVGEPFDANFHHALTQQPSDTVPEGHVLTEFKRGWLLNGKLLREAQVVVSSGPAAK